MYAVIKTGGKQYNVTTGDVVKLEKIAGEEGKEVVFKQKQTIKFTFLLLLNNLAEELK